MLTQLIIEASHVSLVCKEVGFSHRRPLKAAELLDIVGRYAQAREAHAEGNEAALLALGRELYRWLDGKEGWMSELRGRLTPPLILEIQADMQPDAGARTVLQAPWELLADDDGYLAGDALLRFAPARRLGPAQAVAKPDDYRLGIAFMAAAPEGVEELDYEAEEAAILRTAREGVDLYVEDSGDPEELGYRLSALETPLPVLHLSCHGHNAWRVNGQLQPVLMLENPQGDRRPTAAGALLDALGSYKPRLLMLSACLSAAVGVERGTAELVADSLASAFVRAGLPAVLGWDGSVADVAATRFAQELYDRLGQRQPLVEAAAGGRRALLLATAASGGTGGKDRMGSAGLGELSGEEKVLRRDWHLARVWLGPGGGGVLVGGTRKRSLLRLIMNTSKS